MVVLWPTVVVRPLPSFLRMAYRLPCLPTVYGMGLAYHSPATGLRV